MSENRISNSFLQKRNRGIGGEDPFIIGDGEDNTPNYIKDQSYLKGDSRAVIVQEGIEKFGEAVVDDPIAVGKAIATGIKEDFLTFKKDPKKYVYDATANVVQSIKNVGTKSLSDYLPEGTTEERATAEQMTAARQAQLNDYLSASVVIPAASVVKQSSKIIRKALPETGLLNEPTFVNTTANLKSLLQGDREFLMESKNPNLQGVGADVVKTAAIGDNQGPELDPRIDSDDPGINPTKPKSEVAPLVRPLDADVSPITDRGDFYSPILANLDNLPIGKDGMLGSNIIKFLTKKASNINKTELNWSQLLFSGKRITDSENPTQLMEGEIPTLGIDPDRKYTKSEIKFLAKQNLPQITIQKLNPSGPNEGAPYQNTQRVPIFITKETKENLTPLPDNLANDPTNRNLPMEQRRRIALNQIAARDAQTTDTDYLTSIGLNEDIIEAGIRDLPDSIPIATRRSIVILRWAGDRENKKERKIASDFDYEETILRNNNTMGNTYRKSRAHYPDIEGSENIIAHSRGGYYLLDGDVPDEGGSFPAKSIFVLEELQTDAVQSGRNRPSTVASEATTKQTKDFLKEKELFDQTEGPGLGSVENEDILARKLSALIQKNFDEGEAYLSTSDRFNRFADIESETDPFALAKQEEALDKISFDVNESKRILDQHYYQTGRLVDARNKVVQYLSNKYEKFGITINSLVRGTDTFRSDSDGDVFINKVLTNFIGDLVYTKSVAKKENLSGGISNTISNKGGPEAPELNLSPVKLSETVRLSILATIKNSLSEDNTTIVIPPLKDIMKAHSLKQKPAEATYVGAVTKVLKDLQSETKGKINFRIGKIDRLEFESEGNYTIIDFEDFKIAEGTQLRLAEGGVVQPMEQQMQNILQEGGIGDDGMLRDPVSGNEIPPGSLANEVRDDIPAQLSEGEYVVPADVVRFFGVKLFEDLRLEAKKGLQGMEDNGRIGGEKIPNPSSNEITDADVDQIEQMLSEEGVESGGLNQGGLLEKLVKTAQSNSMVNERMRASGIPMQMNAGGAIGQQIPSNSQYNDPKKIDAVISKIASAAQQNPKLLRMLTERGINIPTNLASQNSEQLRKSNLPSQTTEPITNAASGGFIPTENYTEVQDMISNKAKKSSNVDNQMTQNFYHGGSVHDSYSVADVLAAPSLPGSYLTPGAGTLGSSGSDYQSAPIGPQEPEGGCAEGFMWNGIACVPIPVTVQSNNNDDDNNRPPPEPPKPWYEEEAIGDLSDDTWIENKLNPEEQPQGFVAGILSNMPIAKFGRHVQKYTNIAEVRAASRLALAAGKIDDKRLAEIEANLQGYIKSEGLNETWSSISQGNFQEKSVMRSFDLDGDPSNLTEAEYNAYITASGGVVEPVVETVTPKSTDVTDKETIAANLQKANIAQNTETAAERRDRKRENRESAAQVSTGTTASKKAAQSKVKAGTSKKVIRDLSGATVKAGSGVGTNEDGSDFSGPMNKGGLMKKKKK